MSDDELQYIVDDNTMRAATSVMFGIALYHVIRDGDVYRGTHAGVTGSTEEAERWIHGDDDIQIVKVYPLG